MERRFRVSCGRLLCSWMVQACSSFVIYGLQLGLVVDVFYVLGWFRHVAVL
jgi:hypothetical protein